MDWKHGYFAESGYTYDFHAETAPSRLNWVALLKGFKTKKNNFRYLDLGCGQGVSLVHMAALHPDSEFIGIDFMPEHIAHAKELAQNAALENINFIEADFAELANGKHTLGEFDYIIAHGITTWVSPEICEALFKFSSLALKPGGLMYNGYNTYPGWLEMAPFQHLVIQLSKKYDGENSISKAKKLFDAMQNARSPIFEHFPKLTNKLSRLDNLNPSYLTQEYNNSYWAPVYCDKMLKIAESHKLKYIGSSNSVENFNEFIPHELLNIFNNEKDLILKESIRDTVLATAFRRDIYVKGGLRTWNLENWEIIFEQRFIASELKKLPKAEEYFEIKAGSLDIKGEAETYGPILKSFGSNGNSFFNVLNSQKVVDKNALSQVISVLMHGGWLEIEGDADLKIANRLNIATVNAALKGAPYNYLCLPKISTSAKISGLDILMIGLLNNEVEPTQLNIELEKAMKAINMSIKISGQSFDSTPTNNKILETEVENFLKLRLKNYQRLNGL